MKHIIRNILIYILVLYLVILYIPGVEFNGSYQLLAAAGASLALLIIFIRPILKVLFLPINILTLGLFSGLINIILLYLLNRFFDPLQFSPWDFPGFEYQGLIIPSFSVSLFWTYVLVSIIISTTVSLIGWLCD